MPNDHNHPDPDRPRPTRSLRIHLRRRGPTTAAEVEALRAEIRYWRRRGHTTMDITRLCLTKADTVARALRSPDGLDGRRHPRIGKKHSYTRDQVRALHADIRARLPSIRRRRHPFRGLHALPRLRGPNASAPVNLARWPRP